jgi:hypothetical protein
MTGTAATEADEFAEIYKLEVIEIPTNVPVARKDEDDEVYRTAMEKYEAVIRLIGECRERNQPCLVGTTSIEKSELISSLLKKAGIPHNVLNARYHEQEAGIVAQAGRPGAVTIATNMAGRGTDIKLGGNADMLAKAEVPDGAGPDYDTVFARHIAEVAAAQPIVKAAGGLFVIGTERHESRRIDNQLRGRSGRQGDPGGSRFFLSLEDDLMRIFGSDRMGGMLQKLGLKEGEAIIHPWINKALEKAQKKVEARNFDTRKNLLKYDDVMNDQRREVYAQRRAFMDSGDLSESIAEMRRETIGGMVDRAIPRTPTRAVGPAGPPGAGAGHARPRPAGGGVGPRGGHRRDADPRAHPVRRRPRRRRQGRQSRPGLHAHGREVPAAAGFRPSVEGAPAEPGSPAPGHRPTRLWPAGPPERVQARSLRLIQQHAGGDARARDLPPPSHRAAAQCAPARAGARADHRHAASLAGWGKWR